MGRARRYTQRDGLSQCGMRNAECGVMSAECKDSFELYLSICANLRAASAFRTPHSALAGAGLRR